MIRPASLFTNDSSNGRVMMAPANNIKEVDCGIRVLPCCCPSKCQRLATPTCFLAVAICLALTLALAEGYLYSTISHIGIVFQFSPVLIDWLLSANSIFQGALALLVAHWGARFHRPAWLGGLTCMHGVAAALLVAPYLEHSYRINDGAIVSFPTIFGPWMCLSQIEYAELENDEVNYCWLMLTLLLVYQLFVGLANISFWSHGVTYIDDNVNDDSSPIYLAILLAVRLSAVRYGYLLAILTMESENWWVVYPALGGLMLLSGTLMALFPQQLINTILKQTAASILDMASANSINEVTDIDDDDDEEESRENGFFATIKRVLTNKIVVVNTICMAFLLTALINFYSYESPFLQSQFHMPYGTNVDDPWTSRLIADTFKGPFFILCIIVAGLIFAKLKPGPKVIAFMNAVVIMLVAAIYLSFIFVDCKEGTIAGEERGRFITPFCSHDCGCSVPNAMFEPVCIVDHMTTYFSPCHAGCRTFTLINDITIFENCTCGRSPHINIADRSMRATRGACDAADCFLYLTLFQILSIAAIALIGSSLVGHVLLMIRAVRPSDKAVTMGFMLTVISLLAAVPGKFAYQWISDSTCLFRNMDGYNCNFHATSFGDHLSILTGSLLIVAAILALIVLYLARNVLLYVEDQGNYGFRLAHLDVSTPTYQAEEEPLNMPQQEPQLPRRMIRSAPVGHQSPIERMMTSTPIYENTNGPSRIFRTTQI